MAKNFDKNRFTCNVSRKFSESFPTIFFVLLFFVPVYADLDSKINNVLQRPSEEFVKYEVIKPTVQHGRNKRHITHTHLEGGNHIDELTLRYNYGEKEVIIDLKLNRNLISLNHFMRYQLPNGTDAVQRFTKADVDLCQYKGTIRNNYASLVAISTCYGIKGMIIEGNETFYIESKHNGSIHDEHFLYRHSDRVENQSKVLNGGNSKHENPQMKLFKKYENLNRKHKRSTDNVVRPNGANEQSSFVELVLVVDNSIYRNFGRNMRKIHSYCKHIANVVNVLYMPLNIFVTLEGIAVWNVRDQIHLSRDSEKTLESFLQYRHKVLSLEHPNDNAHLLTNQKFERGVVGKANVGSMCSHTGSGGITSNHSQNVNIIASTLAHEMGHNFGMDHDSTDCKCRDKKCIMSPQISSDPPLYWSSCSIDQLKFSFQHRWFHCLRNKPTELFSSPVCGNGLVEPGEQCDCGPAEFCQNSCCNPNTCMLHSNATCASGECCDLTTCHLRTVGTICRTADGECDLPEYCSGESEYCPENYYKRDTELCGGGKAYCYQGACQSHNDQCKLLWGHSGESMDECYVKNLKGDSYGNCGKNWLNDTYRKCVKQDTMCGQLQCKAHDGTDDHKLDKDSRVEVRRGYSYTYPYVLCKSIIVDIGLHSVDPGLTPNGAICGDEKMCFQQKCLPIETLRARGIGINCPENCSGHGVCNNKGHCHCDAGFAPPLCNSPDFSGPTAKPVAIECPDNCSGHGVCNNVGHCHCDDGFAPPLCDREERSAAFVIVGAGFLRIMYLSLICALLKILLC